MEQIFFIGLSKECLGVQMSGVQMSIVNLSNVQAKIIPKYLYPWMRDIADTQITEVQITQLPFYIMRREVTVEEFKQYYDELSQIQQKKFGQEWQKDADNAPVASIPWEAADGYAKWLSRKTGCSLALPTRSQWRAAVIQYAKPEEANVRKQDESKLQHRKEKLATVVDLLGNLREWSKEKCLEHGYYTLGEDYKTYRWKITGKPVLGQLCRLLNRPRGFRRRHCQHRQYQR